MRPGQPERRTHDDVRHGTTSLFAALEVVSGRIIGQCHRRHRPVEFRRFLDTIAAAVPADLGIHLILTTTRPTTDRDALAGGAASYYLHFTPIGAWWIHLVELWFARLT